MKEQTVINASVLQENLKVALGNVGKFVSARSTLPVLQNVLVESDKGRLKITGTNLEASLSVWVGAKIETEFRCTVPYKTLNDFVATLPPERIDMMWTAKNATLRLDCARSNSRIKGIDAGEFPIIQNVKDVNASVDPVEFRQAITRAAFAAAIDDDRPVLSGVFFNIEKSGRITLSAADGFRLSVATMTSESVSLGSAKKGISAIVPAKYLENICKMFGEDEKVEIAIGETGIQFSSGAGWCSHSNLIDGTYPDVSKVIPSKVSNEFTLNVGDFQNAVKMAGVFAREDSKRFSARMSKNGKGTHVKISAESSESGDGMTDIDASSEDECDELLKFDYQYVADVLNVMNSPQVKVSFSNGAGAVLFTPSGADDFKHAIMPMSK